MGHVRHSFTHMRWPIDDRSDQDLAGYLFGLGVGKQVRERLLLERSIARRHGFACFADYFMARRARGWGTGWLTRRDKPGIGCAV
jgi:hypothetical protein